MSTGRRLRLALVVPSLAGSGGVQAVGRFIRNAALRSDEVALQLVSLSESSRDPMSLRLTSPRSWFGRPSISDGILEGLPYQHVGAVAGELEFQRYRPRRVLSQALAHCDVIQVVCGTPAWALSVMGAHKPVSMHVATLAKEERRRRDASPRSLSDWWRKGMTSATVRMDDRALRSVNAIQVMNPWMFEHAKAANAGRTADVRYLPPGVDTSAFCPGPPDRPTIDPYVLCVGRLTDPRKNIGLLFEAFARLPEKLRLQTRLHLVGAGPSAGFTERLRSLNIHDRVTFIEQADSATLLRLYQGAAVFALPSDEEGFGMVLLEAMACAVPVVSTRSGGPDGIITDAEDGYLVARDDAAALSARIALLLDDPQRAAGMGKRARQTIERRYDDRIAGPHFVDVWRRLASA